MTFSCDLPTLASIQSVVATLALGVGAFVAWSGLQTWKAQLRGKTEYDLARRLMRKVLQVRDDLASARHPFITGGEMEAALREADVDPSTVDFLVDRRINKLVYDRRWRRLASAASDLHLEVLEAEVMWGKQVVEAEAALLGCVNSFYAAVFIYLKDLERPVSADERARQRSEDNFHIVHAGSVVEGEDLFAKRVSQALTGFENIARPHLRLEKH